MSTGQRIPGAAGIDQKWQRRLLPFMTVSIVVLALLFFALSLYNAQEVRRFVAKQGEESVREHVEQLFGSNAGTLDRQSLKDRSLLLLEAEAMDKRYAQASALLMSRVWTRQLTFITGMVLAFIGAVFILGKLREDATQASLGSEGWKAAISSSSPGLVLAFFGTTLIALTLIVQPQIGVQDRPIYFAGVVGGESSGVAGPGQEFISPAALDPGLSESKVEVPGPANKPGVNK